MNRSSIKKLTILIVNYDGELFIKDCIDSLFAIDNSSVTIDIVLVDNKSKDKSLIKIEDSILAYSPESISQIPPGRRNVTKQRLGYGIHYHFHDAAIKSILLISASENYGFAGGNNLAAAAVEEYFDEDADVFWLLNSDTTIAPDSVDELVKKLASDNEIGVCGTAILHQHDKATIQSMGGSYYQTSTGRAWAYMRNEAYSIDIDETSIADKINFISGASMAIYTSLWRKVNGLSEAYFLYNEEIDLTFRLPITVKLGVAARAKVYHRVGGSIGTESAHRPPSKLSSYHQTRSKLIFATTHTPAYLPIVWVFLLLRAIKHALFHQYFSSSISIISALLFLPWSKK